MESNHKHSHFDSCLQSVCDVFGRFLYHDAAMAFEGFRTARCVLLDCNTYGRSKPNLLLLVSVISWLLAWSSGLCFAMLSPCIFLLCRQKCVRRSHPEVTFCRPSMNSKRASGSSLEWNFNLQAPRFLYIG